MRHALLLIPLFIFANMVAGAKEVREWTNSSGQSFEGYWVALTKDSVTVKRTTDAREFTINLDDLSKADQDYAYTQLGFQPLSMVKEKLGHFMGDISGYYKEEKGKITIYVRRWEIHLVHPKMEGHRLGECYFEIAQRESNGYWDVRAKSDPYRVDKDIHKGDTLVLRDLEFEIEYGKVLDSLESCWLVSTYQTLEPHGKFSRSWGHDDYYLFTKDPVVFK